MKTVTPSATGTTVATIALGGTRETISLQTTQATVATSATSLTRGAIEMVCTAIETTRTISTVAAVATNPGNTISGTPATNFETTAPGVTADTTIATSRTGRGSRIPRRVIPGATDTTVAALTS
ncbi:hypothetical protein [Mycolicibacter kumamotonensis]|uniref:Uncharacterized protein n=1 Tax=Mycolicibacter kumamotonensis TaxID=354243 RepID=A0A1B8S8E2_9MYCO|nr:hypothetical protein [Mycolicibacter kumamotonensis]OBY29011.1 hypothetical protein ACT18_25420 [Mycolicibacter kumamotonensis]